MVALSRRSSTKADERGLYSFLPSCIRVNSCPFVVTISEASRIEMSRYLIVIEETSTGYSAYSPDLPGCIATGTTRDRVEREMHNAIEFHLDGLRRAGEPIPAPHSQASYCEWSERVERHGR